MFMIDDYGHKIIDIKSWTYILIIDNHTYSKKSKIEVIEK